MQSPPPHRVLKLESDALWLELNEWRDHATILRIEEPMRSDGFSMILSGELEVIAAVPGDGHEEDGYDGEGGKDGGYGGAYMDDIEEERQYSTVLTQRPNVQMHLEEMDDQRVASMLKNSILSLCTIRLFAFTLPLAHNRRLARPLFLFPVGTNRPTLPPPNWPCRKFNTLLLPACIFLLLPFPINIHLIAPGFKRPFPPLPNARLPHVPIIPVHPGNASATLP